MPATLIPVLGDQLTPSLSSLAASDPADSVVVMAEVLSEATYVPHHKQKLVLVFAAMRHFADGLRQAGWQVDYYPITEDLPDLNAALACSIARHAPMQIVATECNEWRLDQIMRHWAQAFALPVTLLPDDRFLCSKARFQSWARGRRQLRMEFFYRDMRRHTGLLMDRDGQPAGGRWNFDSDNRKRYTGSPPLPHRRPWPVDTITQAVIDTVRERFAHHFGELEPFRWPVTREQADVALADFLDQGLPAFGDYQDAMTDNDDFLFHSALSPAINLGLLTPREVCQAAAQRYHDGRAPLNAVEGFIRQIIGWREYVRGIYWLTMPEYLHENRLDSHRPLPWFYWSGDTGMHCVSEALRNTREHAYAHHIQRLMVTGNLALLLGVSVQALHEWYLAVYADAYEWVELPNTLGMVMHADGGYLGSKPYAASGRYIQRMSDYCAGCRYNVNTADQHDSCPFNSLYWHFIDRHRRLFGQHPRMKMIYRNWQRMAPERRAAILRRANALLASPETL
ncbi:deoxyribodipyrimidine photolyase-like protein [Alcanivorax sp. S71-1-4]|uniref:cryptochrome/photolyase family protein n=1 Tax=Alcanivorax sp. S71-1-4 TaxID=1177159 RepID=UPI00135A195B|nr:cryptochrome/photolyase family protein [Alcanivorax sp. S71-1-4]KAF0808884.1 deoxyribodipyrimidine photolyase-like protein [Alcanivorax sp. S71-1-4]